jgi:elongation factor Ts
VFLGLSILIRAVSRDRVIAKVYSDNTEESMVITSTMVKDLRAVTGAGVLDCRSALEGSGGDINRAAEILRQKGLTAAADKAGRQTKEGLIGSYIHTGSKLAALVEVNCETDFVARTEAFQTLARDIAMQVVATRPQWVRSEDVPAEALEKVKSDYRAQMADTNKPSQVIDRIIEGQVSKFCEENCLMEQFFIKDENKRVKDLVAEFVAKVGENVVVKRFARLEVGG